MKHSHIAPLLMVCALLAQACQKNSFTLSGQLDEGAGHTLYLEELTPDGPLFIDSIRIDANGKFKYKYKMPYRSLFNLHTTADNYAVLLPDYGEHLTVSGDYRNLSMTYYVSGSAESALLWQLQDYTNDGSRLIMQLVDTTQHYRQLLEQGLATEAQVKAKKAETDSIYRLAFETQQNYVCSFIEDNAGSLATLIALYKPFNNRPLIAPELNPEYYQLVLEGLQQSQPDNPHTIHFKNTVERLMAQLEQ